MRNINSLFSAVQFLMIAALFGLGGGLIALHYLPHTKAQIADWVIQSESFLPLGCLVLAVVFILTMGFWAMQRSSYLRLEMKGTSLSADEALIRELIQEFWKEEFPSQKVPVDVFLAKKKIEIVIPMPEDFEESLEKIETCLGKMLFSQLGYEKEFFISFTQ